jgi:excisionase family DNA binding protein
MITNFPNLEFTANFVPGRHLLKVKDAAALMNINTRVLYDWIRKKKFRAIKFESGTLRIHPDDLDLYHQEISAVEFKPFLLRGVLPLHRIAREFRSATFDIRRHSCCRA